MINYSRNFRMTQLQSIFIGIFYSITLIFPTFADDGVTLFKKNSTCCHGSDARGSERIAPPIFAVKNHYLSRHKSEKEFVVAMMDWLKNPDQNETLMPGAIKRFGVMPPIELKLQERETISRFVYDTDFQIPNWYRRHFREEHGEEPKAAK